MLDLTPALPTFVITLREGVEAALVVGIVLAYLQKAEQTQLNPWVYSGIGSGLLASIGVGSVFAWLFQLLGSTNQVYAPVFKPLLQVGFGLAAIAMLSWMLIWMTQQARLLKSQVEGSISYTLTSGDRAGWGIFGLIFIAVLREGFETVLFLAAKFQQGWMPLLGAVTGLLGAVGIGILLFRLGIKINLRQFFQVMGIFLLLIVAGLVVSALGHLDLALDRLTTIHPTANFCIFSDRLADPPSCILGPLLWDTGYLLPERQFPGIVFHTLFGYEDHLFLMQAIGYVLFLGTIGIIYLYSLTGWGSAKAVVPSPPSAGSAPDYRG
ncbi:FTR1 family iron permease [Pantanalinema sp. GBBB05]|uniref:FTR1 family iron permease n=1 Tax=Pantanalinema sp. GBBB05 TaxID=2604139 RepID=UPI001D9EB575|nr:FTR1 family iron permease [Pantanalinema sp. GBBB05]